MRWTTRLHTRLLMITDRLFGTRLVQWELGRQQRKIERLTAQLNVINRDLEALAQDMAAQQLVLCLIELAARRERMGGVDWLCFAPRRDGEEVLLDSAIEHLVKPRLASVDVEPDGDADYTYHLHLDWTAIAARLESAPEVTELIAWMDAECET